MVNAIFLHVFPPKRKMAEGELSSIRRQLEGQFVSLLERGVGCGIIYAANEVELISAVEKLRLEEATLSAHLFSWASGESAHHLAKAVSKRPELWATVVFDSPDTESFLEVSPPSECPKSLCLMPMDGQVELASKMIEWARASRQNVSPFTVRMGGLFHLYSAEIGHSHAGLAFGYAYLIDCLKHIGNSEGEASQASLSIESKHTSGDEFSDHNYFNQTKPDSAEAVFEELKRLSSGQTWASASDGELVFSEDSVSFDCQVLRDYRAIKPELDAVRDKDLILHLGSELEKLGTLEAMGKKDEVFLLYYKSLRELESSP
ncbi:MAG: hypothetical protein HN548_00995, partial [Opitutae bacterium]|nr:hypothetical protein [Opitutae bacterium]